MKLFATVCVAATVGSVVGLIGVHRYRNHDVDMALARLAEAALSPDSAEANGDSSRPALESLLGMNQGTTGPSASRAASRASADQRLKRLGSLAESYRRFRSGPLSSEVKQALSGVCENSRRADPDRCVRHARYALITLRNARDQSRLLFEVTLVVARTLWGMAFVLAALWLYRTYARIGRDGRRPSETA